MTETESDAQEITAGPALRLLWIGVAVTFFTYAAGFLKAGFAGRLNATFPHFLILLIAAIGLAGVITGRYVIRTPVIERLPGRWIAFSMLAVVLLHLMGTLRAYDDVWALRETIKIAVGFVTFWCVVAMFPRNREFEERFWVLAAVASAVAVAILIYRYYFVFNSPFLGNNWAERVRVGRNLLGWYLAMLVPISYAGALLSRQRILMSAATMVLVVATIYTGSRSALALMSLGVAIVSVLSLTYRQSRRDAVAGMALAVTVLAVLIFYKWSLVADLVENSEMYLRLIDFVASEGGTAEIRTILAEKAWECFKGGSLLFGIGVKNVVVCVGQSTEMTKEMVVHNDYLSILADMGIIGFVFYLAIMVSLLTIMIKRLKRRAASVNWVDMGLFAAATIAMIYLNLSTAYNSPLLWSMLGFAVVGGKLIDDNELAREN